MRPSQKDDKAQMLLATGVVLMMSLLSMAIFAIKLAGMSVPHDVASDAVIQTSLDVEATLPGLVEARAEIELLEISHYLGDNRTDLFQEVETPRVNIR